MTDDRFPREVPAWYRDAKFGIMIHWGLYSVPAWAPLDDEVVSLLGDGRTAPVVDSEVDPLARHSYAEWYQNTYLLDGPTRAHHRETYGDRSYADFRSEFEDSVRSWDPAPWADLCAASGARYVVPVSKHHDGFLLWPSSTPNPTVPDWSTARDVIGELATAVRTVGLRYGVYYSGGLDWTFGNLPIRRMADIPDGVPTSPEYARYVDAHWRELIERYRPSMLWNDIGYPRAGDPHELIDDYYTQVPDGVVNDRFEAKTCDVQTPEYRLRVDIDPVVWETVRGLGLSFGWNRQETAEQLLSSTELVHLLADVVSKNGNLLLGITPDDRGVIPGEQAETLRTLGRWLSTYGEAIYDTRPWHTAEAVTGDGVPVRFTQRDDTLYAIVLGTPGRHLTIPGLELGPGARARILGADADTDVAVRSGTDGVDFTLGALPDSPAQVLAIEPADQVSLTRAA
ncbi:alpha-L-fucosidase [Micromonospora sp. 067-2]|uniref:alpha-L-fucosidase n=1 Tax=Micromonospora sp. 067-2 TaxID=2789270 RepID=UPI0039785F9B